MLMTIEDNKRLSFLINLTTNEKYYTIVCDLKSTRKGLVLNVNIK